PTEGWTIVPHTAELTAKNQRGQYTPPRVFRADVDHLISIASTSYQSFIFSNFAYDHGSLDFSVSFDESKTETKTVTKIKQISLAWGENYAFFPKRNWSTWKVTVEGYDGLKREMIGHDTKTYVQVTTTNGGYQIEAVLPEGRQTAPGAP